MGQVWHHEVQVSAEGGRMRRGEIAGAAEQSPTARGRAQWRDTFARSASGVVSPETLELLVEHGSEQQVLPQLTKIADPLQRIGPGERP